jgi:hypothetical protein
MTAETDLYNRQFAQVFAGNPPSALEPWPQKLKARDGVSCVAERLVWMRQAQKQQRSQGLCTFEPLRRVHAGFSLVEVTQVSGT